GARLQESALRVSQERVTSLPASTSMLASFSTVKWRISAGSSNATLTDDDTEPASFSHESVKLLGSETCAVVEPPFASTLPMEGVIEQLAASSTDQVSVTLPAS